MRRLHTLGATVVAYTMPPIAVIHQPPVLTAEVLVAQMTATSTKLVATGKAAHRKPDLTPVATRAAPLVSPVRPATPDAKARHIAPVLHCQIQAETAVGDCISQVLIYIYICIYIYIYIYIITCP